MDTPFSPPSPPPVLLTRPFSSSASHCPTPLACTTTTFLITLPCQFIHSPPFGNSKSASNSIEGSAHLLLYYYPTRILEPHPARCMHLFEFHSTLVVTMFKSHCWGGGNLRSFRSSKTLIFVKENQEPRGISHSSKWNLGNKVLIQQ